MKHTITFTALSLLLIFSFCSCSKKTTAQKTEIKTTAKKQTSSKAVSKGNVEKRISLWNAENKKIYIVFGYGFNDEKTLEAINTSLSEKYGLNDDNEIIKTYVFPGDFKHGIKSYSSDLYSYLSEPESTIGGLIILGAPENTHIALGRLQDHYDMEVPFPVVALFPQDDPLGLESTCDIVIDISQKAEITGEELEEETAMEIIDEARPILFNTIDFILSKDGVLEKDMNKMVLAENLLKKIKFSRYMDPETNIHSINHFIIQQKEVSK
jgi:hypothetical protein